MYLMSASLKYALNLPAVGEHKGGAQKEENREKEAESVRPSSMRTGRPSGPVVSSQQHSRLSQAPTSLSLGRLVGSAVGAGAQSICSCSQPDHQKEQQAKCTSVTGSAD